MVDFKVCSGCKLYLPANSYHKSRKCKSGLAPQCKTCREGVIYAGNQRRRDAQIVAAGRPPNRCDACGAKLEPGRGPRSANWDHNHETGEFRGWLCGGCNTALGHAGENPRVLEQLLKYVTERGSAPTRPVIK